MNTEYYFNSLRRRLRGLFVVIRDGHQPPLDERRYVEGFMHASMELGLASSEELKALMEAVNQEVFGMSIAERSKRYRGRKCTEEGAYDTPTWMRRGIEIGVVEE